MLEEGRGARVPRLAAGKDAGDAGRAGAQEARGTCGAWAGGNLSGGAAVSLVAVIRSRRSLGGGVPDSLRHWRGWGRSRARAVLPRPSAICRGEGRQRGIPWVRGPGGVPNSTRSVPQEPSGRCAVTVLSLFVYFYICP